MNYFSPILRSIVFILILQSVAFAQSPLHVGAVLPLSGDLARVGNMLRRGIELRVKAEHELQIELEFEDEGNLNSASAVSAIHKLSASGSHIILSGEIDTIESIAPVLSALRVPGIVLWDSLHDFTQFGPYAMATGFSAEDAGARMARHARHALSLMDVAVVRAEGKWAETIATSFERTFVEEGGSISNSIQVGSEENDFRALILRLKKAHVSAIYFPLYFTSLQSFVRQLRALEFEGVLMSGNGFTLDDVSALGPNAEGIYITSPWLENSDFARKYFETFGERPTPVDLGYVAAAFDTTDLVVHAASELVRQSVALTRQNLVERLRASAIRGVAGPLSISTNQSYMRQETLLQVRDGTLRAADIR